MTMRNNSLRPPRWGMTLVELLVVVAIMGLLLAVSVPLLAPMLKSRKTSNAAQVLAGAFQSARAKSIEEGKSYGIRLLPFANAQTVSVQLRLQKEITGAHSNSLNWRAVVRDGAVKLYFYRDPAAPNLAEGWRDYDSISGSASTALKNDYETEIKWFQQGYRIQFNYLDNTYLNSGITSIGNGTYFKLGKEGTKIFLEDAFKNGQPVSYTSLNLPEETNPNTKEAMLYRIVPPPVMTTWHPQIVMPRSTVVDLVFSGGESTGFNGKEKTPDDIPTTFSANDEVIVMFSPRGSVSRVYINRADGKQEELRDFPVNEMLYFCVGEWDRQVDASGNALAEDGKTNLEAPATFWVTLHPKTGEVRITENAPVTTTDKKETKARLNEARKFAKEHFFNVGGY